MCVLFLLAYGVSCAGIGAAFAIAIALALLSIDNGNRANCSACPSLQRELCRRRNMRK